MNKKENNNNKKLYIYKDSLYTIDDLTFKDLNLDDIFEKMNYCCSSLGEEVLYSILRQPLFSADDLADRNKLIEETDINSSECKSIKKELSKLSKLTRYSVFEYLNKLNEVAKISVISRFKAIILFIAALVLMILDVKIGIIAVLAVYIYNSIEYFKYKSKIEPYFICVSYLSKAVSISHKIDDNKADYKELKFLKYSSLLLGAISGQTVNGGSGNPLDVILSILKLGLHIDIIRFYSLLKRIDNNKDLIFDCLYKIGYKDSIISIATFRKKLDYYCVPSFVDDGINICEGYHLLNANPVSNSIKINNSILLTGSNASGKSTFLRMVADSIILSQTICTVFAKEYEAPLLKVISSMSVLDDINKSESYYMAEIKGIKRIIDLANESKDIKVICFIDEVLKGTNTKERIAASTKLLEYLNKVSVCLAATHDIELTKLLADKYINYHFNEIVNSDDISFSYKLKEGPANTTNAIKLLEIMGFPKDITDGAYDIVNSCGF